MEKKISRFREFTLEVKSKTDEVRRAFTEFLAVPSLIILLFLLLAFGVYLFERSEYVFASPVRGYLQEHVFAEAQATSDLLSSIAGSIITVTSITTTLLLLIVQQSAGTMTTQVFDQFLRRRSNQVFFGYFIGLALYTLITLATVDEPFNPVYSAALAYIFTVIALYLLILLFYSTIHQMRPSVIIEAIHDHTLVARKKQQDLLRRTRRKPKDAMPIRREISADYHGFVTSIDLNRIASAIEESKQASEVILLVSIGRFVSYQDVIAEVRLLSDVETDTLEKEVRDSIYMERSRNIDSDPAFGIKQLELIAWSALSPAKGNLTPGLESVYNMRNLLARWAEENHDDPDQDELPIVYNDDVVPNLISAMVSLAIVASQTMEHQILVEILNAFSRLYPRLPDSWQENAEAAVIQIIPTLRSYYRTDVLEDAIVRLAHVLRDQNKMETAMLLEEALSHFDERAKNESKYRLQ